MYKDYYGKIDFNVKNNSHTQAFIFLQDYCSKKNITSPKVLEVGCSSGYFSAAMKEHGIYVYGIEPFSDEAMHHGRVDDFFHGTVEDFYNTTHSNLLQFFDVIIFGDVLEHLKEPQKTITYLSKYLKNEGIIIASVPNITHIGIRKMLEDGIWEYAKYGILDSTHLRFFSWYNLKKLFLGVGFGIERCYGVLVPEFSVYPSPSSLYEFSLSSELNTNDHVFQYVVLASREFYKECTYYENPPKNILIISPDPYSTVTDLRLLRPLSRYNAKYPSNIKVISSGACSMHHLDWTDCVIVHREISMYVFEFLKLARKKEIPIIYDTDDLLLELPAWCTSQISLIDRELIKNTMTISDAITCTTESLQRELKKYSDDVHIIPNVCIPYSLIENPKKRHFSDQCTLIIASSDSIPIDFIIPSIKAILNIYKHIKLIAIGNIAHKLAPHFNDITTYAQCDEKKFSKLLHSIDNGIGIIPLDDTLFSSCKSAIKFWHYTACGISTIASNVKPYSNTIQNSITGILVDNEPELWCSAIAEMISNYKKRQQMLVNAIKDWENIAHENIAVEAWKNLFSSLPRKSDFMQ